MATRFFSVFSIALTAILSLVLVGCGGGGSGSSGGSLVLGGVVTGLSPGASLVLQNDLNTVTITTNGVYNMAPVSSSALYSVHVVVQPAGETCTVANGSGRISASVFNANVTCTRIAGSFAYALNNLGSSSTGSISAFTMASGALTALSSGGVVPTGTSPSAMALDSHGSYLYVTNQVDNTVSTYSVSATTGALTASGGAVATGTGPSAIAIDPSGSYAFVINQTDQTISSYKIVNHALVAASPSPTTATTSSTLNAITVDPTGTYVYAVDGNDKVWVYSILKPSGQLSTGTSYALPSGSNPGALVMRPGGLAAYTANVSNASVSELTFDSVAGGLLSTVSQPADLGTHSVAVDPNGTYLLALNADVVTATFFALDPITGAPAAGVETTSLGTSVDHLANIVLDPTGAFAYTTNQSDGKVYAFTVNATAGTLTPLGSVATPGPVAFLTSIGPH